MFSIQLQWLSFPVSLPLVETWINTNCPGSGYVGNSADAQLTLWFSSDPSSIADSINAYWSGLTNASPEATGYQTLAQIQAAATSAKAASIAAATTKLTALGLTSDEIAAMFNQ